MVKQNPRVKLSPLIKLLKERHTNNLWTGFQKQLVYKRKQKKRNATMELIKKVQKSINALCDIAIHRSFTNVLIKALHIKTLQQVI